MAWPAAVTRVSVAQDDASRSDETDSQTATESEPGDVAYVIYTSGSTGQPKGVVVSHAAAMNTIADIQQRFAVCMSDRLLGLSSLSFDLSVFDIFGVLGVGGCLVQVEQGHEKDAAQWATLIERERVSLWNSVPALLQMLVDELEASRRALSPPRTVLLSGDWIPLALTERTRQRWPDCEVVSLGGATEAAIWSIYQCIPSLGFGDDWSSVPYGRPLANQRWHVLSERGEACPDGVPGELYIAGAGLARGYHHDATRTAERFVLNAQTGERLYRTGDWGRYRAGGVLEFLGRKDSQVKVGGHRIELGEVEAAMASHPAVRESVVHARGDARSASKQLVGYAVLDPQLEASPQQLRAHVAARLPEYMVPRVVMVLPALPLSTNGKVDRQALPDPEPTRSAGAHAETTTPQQAALLQLCRELLSRDHVSLGDHFFALGGDSLIAARLSAALRTRFALRLSLRTIFAEPHLEHLADLIETDELMNETIIRQPEAHPEKDFDEGEVALPQSFLERLTARGVKLWSDQGTLRYRAPKGVLSDADKADIAARAGELLRVLGEDVSADMPAERAAVLTFPLSDSQQRFWFFEQLMGSQSAYNIPFTLSLCGDLQVERLRRALSALVQRHESLRARFQRGGAEPVQIIDAPSPVALEVRDFAEVPVLERRLALRAWIEDQASLPFVLEQGGLMRASLAIHEHPNGRGCGWYVLLLSFHHAVADGWSLGVLWAELCELYRAELEVRAPELPTLRMRLVDHVQRERLEATLPRREHGLSYWQRTLTGAPALLELPCDRPRPSVRSLRGATVPWSLPSELVERVRAYARARAGTPYMVLLTAFGALLARLSAQDDLVIGTPVANREGSDVAGLVGVLVNTLALRLRLPAETSFDDAFAQARDVSLDALAHQNVPFERVVEALAPPRSTTNTPIFQAMFAYQSTPARKPELPRVASAPYMLTRRVALFDLTLHAEESEGAVRGLLEYASDIFDPSTAEQMAASFVALLRQCLAEPRRLLHAHLLPAEAQTGAGTRLDGPTLSLTGEDLVMQRIARIAREHSERVALRWTGGQLPYGELQSLVDFTCCALREQGVQSGDVVAVALARGPEWVIAQLAILSLGAVYLPLDPKLPMQRQRYLLEDAGVRLVVCAEAGLGFYTETGLPAHAVATLAAMKAQRDAGQPLRDESAAVGGADTAYVIYTSGSSGAPKGVAIRHESLLNLVLACEQPCRLDGESQVLQAASVSFDASIWEVYATLAHGGCLCIPSDDERMPGPDLSGFVSRHRISHALLTPSVLALIEDSDLADCTTLLVGGETCPLALAQRWARGRRLLNAYGPTECAVITTLGVVAPEANALSLGTPIANVSVCVLDAQRRPVPRGVAGELWIGGQGVAQGYLQRPELTRERFVALEQGASEGALMYRSGDRCRLRPDGTLEYLGRLDRQIKLRGLRIELGEIEAALHALPGVRGAAVLVKEQPEGERRLVGHVAHDDGQAAEPELRAHLSRVLPGYMVPGELVIARTLPTTSRGKLDVAALEAHAEPVSTRERRPSSSREQAMLEIFRELLARPGLTSTHDFFVSGGHSLLAVRAVQRLREELGLEVPLRALFSHPTVERLLRALASETATQDELLWLARGGRGRVIVCVDPPGEPGQRYAALGQALAGQADLAVLRLGGVEEQLDIATLAARCALVLARERITHVSTLVGWSFGAALAFELGQRLQHTQRDAPTLCLLDGLEPAEARRLAELRLGTPAFSIEADALPDNAADPSWQHEGRARHAAKLRALTRYRALPYRGNAIVVAAQGADPTVPADRGWGLAVQDGLRVLAADCLHDDVTSDPKVLRALVEALATRSDQHV
jgi:amino acid adenylation domain-containing protein